MKIDETFMLNKKAKNTTFEESQNSKHNWKKSKYTKNEKDAENGSN